MLNIANKLSKKDLRMPSPKTSESLSPEELSLVKQEEPELVEAAVMQYLTSYAEEFELSLVEIPDEVIESAWGLNRPVREIIAAKLAKTPLTLSNED